LEQEPLIAELAGDFIRSSRLPSHLFGYFQPASRGFKSLWRTVVLMRITRSEAKWNAGAFSSETLEKASRFLRADGTLVLHKQLM
jgi:hypothetical protein